MRAIHVGTSGWNYEHWKGPFYPEELTQEEWFEYYRTQFDTVEINNTFYNLPSPETVAQWREAASDDFRYAVKASRYITHMKKLKDPEESTARFFERMAPLKEKIDIVLFQLPPKWRRNGERLARFLETLPDRWRYAFEFRDESWFNEETYDLLKEHNAAFCLYELAGLHSPEVVTSDTVYVRLHGPEEAYQGSYSGEELQRWAQKCKAWARDGLEVWVYFDNDDRGFAPANATTLKKTLRYT